MTRTEALLAGWLLLALLMLALATVIARTRRRSG